VGAPSAGDADLGSSVLAVALQEFPFPSPNRLLFTGGASGTDRSYY